ncbi:protein VASP homolog [Drosophila santomea]|uniref:protein VASP homolog n=1 Tax=Drosophila santomea TaxID=129105 RepID=UPI001CCE9EED|nr:protein VASP homolog [Drosophila santomea]
MKDDQPVKQRYYPKNPKMQVEINAKVDELLQTGCIEPSRGPYSSPIVMVKKKTGQCRRQGRVAERLSEWKEEEALWVPHSPSSLPQSPSRQPSLPPTPPPTPAAAATPEPQHREMPQPPTPMPQPQPQPPPAQPQPPPPPRTPTPPPEPPTPPPPRTPTPPPQDEEGPRCERQQSWEVDQAHVAKMLRRISMGGPRWHQQTVTWTWPAPAEDTPEVGAVGWSRSSTGARDPPSSRPDGGRRPGGEPGEGSVGVARTTTTETRAAGIMPEARQGKGLCAPIKEEKQKRETKYAKDETTDEPETVAILEALEREYARRPAPEVKVTGVEGLMRSLDVHSMMEASESRPERQETGSERLESSRERREMRESSRDPRDIARVAPPDYAKVA